MSKTVHSMRGFLQVLSLCAAGAVTMLNAQVTVPPPTSWYTFENTLMDRARRSTLSVLGTCPGTSADDPCNSATSFGSDDKGPFWTWNSTSSRGGGFTVTTNQELGNTYTMLLKFSLSSTGPGYRKIIDYKNRNDDTGFYFIGGALTFYPLGTSPGTFADNEVLDLLIVRQSLNVTGDPLPGLFTVYSRVDNGNLQLLINVTDTLGQSIPTSTAGDKSQLGFFFDDSASQSESSSSGKVYDLRTWRGIALTPEQLRTITEEASTAPPAQVPSMAPSNLPTQLPSQQPTPLGLSSDYELVFPFPGVTQGFVILGLEVDPKATTLRKDYTPSNVASESPDACFAACTALVTTPTFYFNLYTENNVKKCTCVENSTGLRAVPQAQAFVSCPGSALGRISTTTKTTRKITAPGKLVKFFIWVKSFDTAEAWNNLGFRVTISEHVKLVRVKSSLGLEKYVTPPVVELNTTTGTGTITWWDTRLEGAHKRQQRKFLVMVRVDQDAPHNVSLQFRASTFVTALNSSENQYCESGPSDLTVKVKPRHLKK